eukprot:TRINITY_DN7757_c0_g1_i1.p1 TRINITY_DN7757_c0_g1~~TRINITY_DN7757_c0_g1_i1.p1  ORF type:complete len:192 (+),score=37.38 TRINITY_DN7757_c0_g1_i1:256-831(+)
MHGRRAQLRLARLRIMGSPGNESVLYSILCVTWRAMTDEAKARPSHRVAITLPLAAWGYIQLAADSYSNPRGHAMSDLEFVSCALSTINASMEDMFLMFARLMPGLAAALEILVYMPEPSIPLASLTGDLDDAAKLVDVYLTLESEDGSSRTVKFEIAITDVDAEVAAATIPSAAASHGREVRSDVDYDLD